MKFLLKLQHWQLFLVMWGMLPVVLCFLMFAHVVPPLGLILYQSVLMFSLFAISAWLWTIATELHKKLPADVKLSVWQFKIFFLIPFVYFPGLLIWLSSGLSKVAGVVLTFPIITVLHLCSLFCILLVLRFAAKIMKSVEIGRMATFSDYAGELLLICFLPLGVWALQPRLNRLIGT
jgi:hypothetical protein